MFCPICGKECADATEQYNHENDHTEEEKQKFQQEQERRREELESKKQMKQNQPELPIRHIFTRGPNYSKIYANDWGFNLTNLDVRIDIFNERIEHPPQVDFPSTLPYQPVEFFIESQIITPIQSAKALYERLGELISHYEKENGEIS